MHKNMKIAMLGHKRIPSREGGVEIVVEELSKRMAKRGHDVTCLNRTGHHVSGAEFDNINDSDVVKSGVKIKKVFTIDKKGIAAMSASMFGAIHAAFGKYDVVHFHAEGPCAMLWLPKLAGKKCIATIHGIDWKRAKWKNGLGAKYILMGEKIAARMADELIVLSKDAEKYFMDTYGRETILIPNGVSRPNLRPADLITKKFGLENEDYMLFLGRLVPEKGISYLIEAFKNTNTDKTLVIAGGSSDSDEYVDYLHELAGDDPRIIFTGFVQGQILEELYSNAYTFIQPSDLEGMPLTLLEAMSYGNCCLTSDIPECADVISDCGVTFRKGDVTELQKKMQFLCDNEKIVHKYKSSSAEFIMSKYSWDDVVNKTLSVYGD